MKKVLKVFLVTMLAVTLLSQVAVFADCTYTTDTSYDLSTGKAKVTSTVYGIGGGEEVTFLVERLNTETSVDEILYIDQINTNDYVKSDEDDTASASFTYLIPAEKADGTARVRFASTSNSASTVLPEDGGVGSETPGTDDTVKLNNYKVTYSVVGEGAVTVSEENGEVADAETTLETNAYATQEVTFYFAPNPGWEIDSYKIGDAVRSVKGLPSTAIAISGDTEIVFTFAETEKSATAVAPTFTADTQTVEHNEAAPTVAERYVTTFASLEANNDIIDYGILVSKEEIVTEGLNVEALNTKTNPVKKFQALGAFNGKYAIKLINGTSDYLDGTLYVVPYAVAKGTDGVAQCSFGEVATVTYNEVQ